MEQEDENGDIRGQKGKSVTIKRNSSRLIKHCKLLSIRQGDGDKRSYKASEKEKGKNGCRSSGREHRDGTIPAELDERE